LLCSPCLKLPSRGGGPVAGAQRVLGAADGEVPPGRCRWPAPSCWDSRGERRGGGEGERGESAGVGEMAMTEGREVPPAGACHWRLERGGSGGGAWRASCCRAWLRAAAWSSEREQGKGRRAGATQATVCILGFVAFVGCQIARNRCSIGPVS